MSLSKEHVSDDLLVKFIEMDLYVDDMIEIDSHVSACAKCQRRLESLKKKSGISVIPSPKSMLLLAGVIAALVAVIVSMKYLNTPDLDMSDSVTVMEHTSELAFDSVSNQDTLYVEEESLGSPTVASAKTNTFEATPTSIEPVADMSKVNETDQPTVDVQVSNDKSQNQEQETRPEDSTIRSTPEVPEESKPLEYVLVVEPLSEQSARPAGGYAPYARLLRNSLNMEILSLDKGYKAELVLQFNIESDGGISKLSIAQCTDDSFCGLVSRKIKELGGWSAFVSDDYVAYSLANVKVTLIVK